MSLVGHSRGAMTIGNAMTSLERLPDATGSLYNTDIKIVGPAYNAQTMANQLDRLSEGFAQGVNLQNHADGFVGTLIGGNPATYDQRPNDSSKIKETVKIFGDAPTVHSCYGTGAVDRDGCISNYGMAPTMNVQPNHTLK